jgi:hypothetical protein
MLYQAGRAAHQCRVVGQEMHRGSHLLTNTKIDLVEAQLGVHDKARFTLMKEE